MFSLPFRADLSSFQPDFAQEKDTKWTILYSFLSTWISWNLLYYFFDWNPWLVKCALVGKCFKKFEWSLNGFPVSNSQPYTQLYQTLSDAQGAVPTKRGRWIYFRVRKCLQADTTQTRSPLRKIAASFLHSAAAHVPTVGRDHRASPSVAFRFHSDVASMFPSSSWEQDTSLTEGQPETTEASRN